MFTLNGGSELAQNCSSSRDARQPRRCAARPARALCERPADDDVRRRVEQRADQRAPAEVGIGLIDSTSASGAARQVSQPCLPVRTRPVGLFGSVRKIGRVSGVMASRNRSSGTGSRLRRIEGRQRAPTSCKRRRTSRTSARMIMCGARPRRRSARRAQATSRADPRRARLSDGHNRIHAEIARAAFGEGHHVRIGRRSAARRSTQGLRHGRRAAPGVLVVVQAQRMPDAAVRLRNPHSRTFTEAA